MFEFDPRAWGILLGLALVVERFVQFFIKPWFERYGLDAVWLLPITWVLGGLAAAATQINLFDGVFMWPWVGVLFTAILTGGGSNFMHETLEILLALKNVLRSRNGS
jgi:hypothetical protein